MTTIGCKSLLHVYFWNIMLQSDWPDL